MRGTRLSLFAPDGPEEELADGLTLWRGYFDHAAQTVLVETLRGILAEAPLFAPAMPRTGTPFSVRMSNCGALGWVADLKGYRYQPIHPVTGMPWPAIPAALTDLWAQLAPTAPAPEACLINWYDGAARMGLHQDRDEETFEAPVLSVSLGDAARFRFGGTTRGGKTQSIRLESGDVLMMGGPSRLCFHGVDRIYPGSSDLLPKGGRINLTLRRVTAV